ncbi:helix-hairpin-helix domain-containing protein [uncultured Chryseobacterium sp.]|uniref:helix-hairpin-helix domain-containing protein n=1 Tax=uncultured Chryseobacterium sp. TaxID=259322 RepID=UPI00261733E7|nr:helix-hairpin-helix domain-containing protein [uncultured Chryseobacterium sp.]
MKASLPQRMRKKQFIALSLLGATIAFSQIGFAWYKNQQHEEIPKVQFLSEYELVTPLILSEFNPNDLDDKQWQNLGFSEKQVKTILNYKKVVGGNFVSKEQLKKCYGISEEKFQELNQYILLPETTSETKNPNFDFRKYEKKELKISGRFNPDQLSVNGWMNMGFTENQANAILKYKNYLGGSFVSKEKFKECFIISAENYAKLAPYLMLPEKTPENFRSFTSNKTFEKPKIQYHEFDPNLLDLEGWKALGFTENQAASILKYKNNYLKGSFRSLEDVEKCFMIKDRFAEMKPFIKLNPENFKNVPTNSYSYTSKTTETTVPEVKTDFSKVDLNQISFKQLREFGFTEKDAAMMLSFRKKLGGFVNKNQISETFEIDRSLAQQLALKANLDASNVAKYSLVDAPENWLKNHPYFKFSADKIIFYRISNPDDKKIWKFIKVKPEYEAKMRLYLK